MWLLRCLTYFFALFTLSLGACDSAPSVESSHVGPAYLEANDEFGFSIAVSGDTMVVGAPGESSSARGVGGDPLNNEAAGSGAAFVYRLIDTKWELEAYLKSSNTRFESRFGASVAISGDKILVGEPDLNTRTGAAYVFGYSDQGWVEEGFLQASNLQIGEQFGASVAIDGDVLVVGAPWERSNATGIDGDQTSNAFPGSGAVYQFRRIGSLWQQEAYIKASNTGPNDHFGQSVALTQDTLVVGANGESSSSKQINGDQGSDDAEDSGAVYVFRRSADSWQQEAYLKGADTDTDDRFGTSVSIWQNKLAVGANREGPGANNDRIHSGGAYVFVRDGTSWSEEAHLEPSIIRGSDQFGLRLSLSDDLLAVSSIGYVAGGAVYQFRRNADSWESDAYFTVPDPHSPDPTDGFGLGVALVDEVLTVGSSGWNDSKGAVYIFP